MSLGATSVDNRCDSMTWKAKAVTLQRGSFNSDLATATTDAGAYVELRVKQTRQAALNTN